MVIKMDNLLTK